MSELYLKRLQRVYWLQATYQVCGGEMQGSPQGNEHRSIAAGEGLIELAADYLERHSICSSTTPHRCPDDWTSYAERRGSARSATSVAGRGAAPRSAELVDALGRCRRAAAALRSTLTGSYQSGETDILLHVLGLKLFLCVELFIGSWL